MFFSIFSVETMIKVCFAPLNFLSFFLQKMHCLTKTPDIVAMKEAPVEDLVIVDETFFCSLLSVAKYSLSGFTSAVNLRQQSMR